MFFAIFEKHDTFLSKVFATVYQHKIARNLIKDIN